MRSVFVLAMALIMIGSAASGQECQRPEWTKCVALPNGGSIAGTSVERQKVEMNVPPGPDLCVINHDEVGGNTYARFGRNNMPWPDDDFGVDIDDFCVFKK